MVALGVTLAVLSANDPEPAPEKKAWYEALTARGAIDVYGAHDFNHPPGHASFLPGTGTSGKRSDEVGLNLVSLEALVSVSTATPEDRPESQPEEAASPPHKELHPPTTFELPAWLSQITLHGAADVYVAHNFNNPSDHANFLPGTGTTAKRSDEIGLNLVSFEVLAEPRPVGFHLWVVAGTGAEVVHLAEPVGDSIGPLVWKHVQQASISASIPVGSGLLLEGGIYPSHIGFESLGSQNCWNYTRSWLGEFSPYYQTGVKAAYGFTDHFSAQVHLLNGWQTIGENNRSLAAGTQLALNWERFSVSFNTFAGPEGVAGDDAHWRFFGDLVVQASITDWLKAGLAADLGLQQLAGRSEAIWHGVTGYLRFQVSPRFAIALRGEYYMDPKGAISGAGQTLVECTGTVEFKPWDNLLLKLEGRYDTSTAQVFTDSTGAKVQSQGLVVLGAVASF